ncbi:hypothetical protein [Actinokineospora xionganensis]|uniref:Uncharacterized protein n=1 Tax=Actinokineospora xionganensis TaxID=2684470 RepID=A0ABR7L2W5_9PSEU|nr:hypothetical protein [Actinokineospora xionganensis]MBC6446838.1 hypothetical protein [Actinokineospora xionganensis]
MTIRPACAVVVASLIVGLIGGVGVAAADHGEQATPVTGEGPGTRFVPVTPVRVLDSRDVTGTVALAATGVTRISLSKYVPADAVAAVLNVTGADASEGTFITVYPDGKERPPVSTLNLVRGQTRANAATVQIGTDSGVNVYNNAGRVHVIVDLAGYYTPDTAASGFTSMASGRVLDTRSGAPVGTGGVVTVDLSTKVPLTATAVTFNLTGVSATQSTYITAWPTGASRPRASNLNLTTGEATPNQVTVALGRDRKVSLYNHAGTVHLLVDPTGFYASDRGLAFFPVAPTRILDTRPARGLGQGETHTVSLAGILPAGASSIVCNVTGTNTTATTYVSIWPTGSTKPKSSHLNLVAGQTAANMALLGLGTDKSIQIYNNAGYVDIVADLAGYFDLPTPQKEI